MAKVAKPSQVKKTSVGLIGAGSMGGALLRGWLEGGIIDAARSAIFDPAVPDQNRMTAQTAGMAINPGKDLAVDVLVVAVKPQISASILPDFAESAASACVLSVMAGKTIAAISGELGGAPRVARAMPNLPSSIGKGACGLYAPPAIDADMRKRLATLLAASGVVVSVESEEAIDVVTAISGSGPAYFFLFTQALEKAGVALGLAPADAALL
ncbi:MAG: pyrroline-5-carboxylate reductase dimerization domain-containing protein, partial [Pseudomonadota bacterium]